MPLLEMLSTSEAAQRLRVSISYLNKLRLIGSGPRFVKLGARVVYDPVDLASWLNAKKRNSTSDTGEAGQ